MLIYIIKRLLLFIPTLVIISIVAFFLSKNAPGDPVERFFEDNYTQEAYYKQAVALHLDKPLFYWSILPGVLPDTFSRIVQPYKKEVIRSLALKTGDFGKSLDYYETFQTTVLELSEAYDEEKSDTLLEAINVLKRLTAESNLESISHQISILKESRFSSQSELLSPFLRSFDDLMANSESKNSGSSQARLVWNGLNNQYHIWISNFLGGNFGYSLVSGKETSDRISTALFWTLCINFSAILLAFLLAIPVGVYAARYHQVKKGKIVTLITYLLYSMPVFWIATLLLIFFTTPEYGMDWFAGVGLGRESGHQSVFHLILDRVSHLLLPILCLVYPSLAFVARQLSGAMSDELKKDYILTARAKGLPESKVVWKHAFRNSLFPLITLFGSILPATIAGSVVIEVIFNIPGMGKLMVDSIFLQDWPIVFIILLLGAILTMTGILLADLLYAKLDPRIRLK